MLLCSRKMRAASLLLPARPQLFCAGLCLVASLAASLAAHAEARLAVRCVPSPVVRGEEVVCTALVVPPQQAVFTERLAIASGHLLRDGSQIPAAPAEPFVWRGTAVLPTTVIVHALAGDVSLRGAASFDVLPRAFPKFEWHGVSWNFGPDELFGGWPPRVRSSADAGRGDHIVADGSLGLFRLTLTSPRTEYVSSGPDARWFFVREPAPPPEVSVLISRALRPGDPFYQAQQAALDRDCGANDLELLRLGVLQHEGAVPGPLPSHYGESKRILEEADLETSLEAMTLHLDEATGGPALALRIDRRIRALLDQLTAQQRVTVDARAPVRLRCRLRPP